MRFVRITLVCALIGVTLGIGSLCPRPLSAQTTINPDISLIGDIRAFGHTDATRPDERDNVNLNLHEAEIAIQGYLNPYARADAFFGWHDGSNAEIEELYFTISRGIPFGIAVRGGRYLLLFDKINPLHPHAYSFIHRPLIHEEFFGPEGLRDVGVRASMLVPIGNVATEISVDVLKNEWLSPHEHEHGHGEDPEHAEEETVEETVPNERSFLGRIESFFVLDDVTSLSIGASALTGIPEEDERRTVGGLDAKFKWKPDRYQSFTAVAEWMVNDAPAVHEHEGDHEHEAAGVTEEHGEESITSHGLFGYFDYQFRQRYNVGAVGDWTQHAEDSEHSTWRLGGFAGFAPVEETTLLRLLVDYTHDVNADDGFWTATLQLVFSLGPHRPHTF